MNIKQKIKMLTLGAVLSTSLVHGVALADSVTVEKGDTLWKLSREHNTTVQNLKEINGLTSNTIYVGQKLEVTPKTTNTNTNNATPKVEKKEASSNVYTIKRGDTLYKIGKKYGVPYQDIKKWNNLKTNVIYSGQKLIISGSQVTQVVQPLRTPEKQTVAPSNQRDRLISFAKKYIGTPYKWGGTTPSGFDCSGFMYYTLKSEGLVSSRTNVVGYWSQVKKVSNPVPGDLVFFQGTYKKGPSHMGIYLGNGQFVHAGSKGVAIDSIKSSYWSKHFLGYGTFF